MKSKRRLLFGAGTVLILLLIAGAMFIVGRGHTVLFDNKTFEDGNQTYPAFYKAVVYDNNNEVAKLLKRERGMATWIGQDFKMMVDVTREKDGETVTYPIVLKLPYHMDSIIVNLPAMLAGLPEDKYMTEFVPQVANTDAGQEEVIVDEVIPSDI